MSKRGKRFSRLLGTALLLTGAAWQEAPAAIAAPSGLTLSPSRTLDYIAHEGTWISADITPDGHTILFDLLGDIYRLDAAGGQAQPILTGLPYESQPILSPDGKRFAFISDRSGSANLWVADIDGSHLHQLSHDAQAMLYTSPSWSPDGRFVYVSRTHYALLAFEIYQYDVEGGTGTAIAKAQPTGHEGFESRLNMLGPVASPDGRYLYFSRKTGTTWTEKPLPEWAIVRHDLQTGQNATIINAPGGAMRPALSHDGRLLVYASRDGEKTGLRVRDLRTGADRWLCFPIDHDSQNQGYYLDLEPRYTFAPDDKSLILSVGGKLARLSLDGQLSEIPFSAHVQLGIGPTLRTDLPAEMGPVKVRIIQAPRISPDGRSIVFAALGRLYRLDLKPGATPQPIAAAGSNAFEPTWSPDGKRIAYVTWSAREGGQLWSVPAAGGRPTQFTRDPAFFTEPAFSPDGRQIAVLRTSQYDRLHTAMETNPALPTDIVLIPAAGGAPALVTQTNNARSPRFSPDGKRIRYLEQGNLESVALDGSDLRHHVRVVATAMSQYVEGPQPVQDVRLSPSGNQALVKAASELYLVDVPPANGGAAPVIDLQSPTTHVTKLTRVGADYIDWSPDGRMITWSVGSTFRRIPLAAVIDHGPGASEAAAQSFAATVELPRDVPKGVLLLHGATVITMRGDEVIAPADVLVVDNHIAAVGKAGTLSVPAGATVRDVTGKYILPGFVDTHAHWFEIRRELLDPNHWDFLATLAYGVTSGLEVQGFTIDGFAYEDMIDAGLMVGPRAFSVGPGVFVNSTLDSKQAAIDVLTRYRDYYRTRNIKSYMVGDRDRRQFMVEASKELGMMPTTEGASDMRMDITHAIDGFAGNEHALPVTPLHDDLIRLFATTRTSYTPTLNVVYGATPALSDMIVRHRPDQDPKVARFIPPWIIDARMQHVNWMPADKQDYPLIAHDALMIQRAGGLVGIGAHGTIQGLGYHFEMEAYAAGGATPMEVLHAATIGSAEVIGRASQIGSIEPGKYADLLILDRNPLDTIKNTLSISTVMKNGRLYDAGTLDEMWPRTRKMDDPWWQTEAPKQ